MKIKFNPTDKIQVEFETESLKSAFKELNGIQEVLVSAGKCGACNNTDIRYVVRTVDDNDYYEARCGNSRCRAKLAFGQHKTGGTLFPKRKDENGNWLDKEGWVIWKKED